MGCTTRERLGRRPKQMSCGDQFVLTLPVSVFAYVSRFNEQLVALAAIVPGYAEAVVCGSTIYQIDLDLSLICSAKIRMNSLLTMLVGCRR